MKIILAALSLLASSILWAASEDVVAPMATDSIVAMLVFAFFSLLVSIWLQRKDQFISTVALTAVVGAIIWTGIDAFEVAQFQGAQEIRIFLVGPLLLTLFITGTNISRILLRMTWFNIKEYTALAITASVFTAFAIGIIYAQIP